MYSALWVKAVCDSEQKACVFHRSLTCGSFGLLYLCVVCTDATTPAHGAPHTVHGDSVGKACVPAARSVWRTVHRPGGVAVRMEGHRFLFQKCLWNPAPGLHTSPQTWAGRCGSVSGHNHCI